MTSAFNDTKVMFISYLNYKEPLSFTDWSRLGLSDQVAALYVQFYDQIMMAWYRTKSFYTPEEDGVTTILQYLNKNAPIIEKNPKRFTTSYIYKVAFNCLYCICHDLQKPRSVWENECSNIVSHDGDETDLFATLLGHDSEIDAYIDFRENPEDVKDRFWYMIEHEGKDVIRFVDCMLSGEPLPKRVAARSDRILETLQAKLADYKEYFYK